MMITTVLGILILISSIICVISFVLDYTDCITCIDWENITIATFIASVVFFALIGYVYCAKTTLKATEYDVKTIAADYGLEPKVHITHYDDTDTQAIWVKEGSKDYIEIEHLFRIKTMKYVVYKNEPRVDDFADYKRDSISSGE